MEFRTIILQDAGFLKDVAPSHEIFKDEIFQSEEFTSFAAQLHHAIDVTVPPSEVEFQRIAPEVHFRISDLTTQIQSLYRTIGEQHLSNNQRTEEIMAGFLSKR